MDSEKINKKIEILIARGISEKEKSDSEKINIVLDILIQEGCFLEIEDFLRGGVSKDRRVEVQHKEYSLELSDGYMIQSPLEFALNHESENSQIKRLLLKIYNSYNLYFKSKKNSKDESTIIFSKNPMFKNNPEKVIGRNANIGYMSPKSR